jgi:Protein of unknown function (DUF2281)
MNNTKLYCSIAALPEALKAEVSDFVAFLQQKVKTEHKIKERKFGYAKGFFKLSPDFDEPLEDFKDYQ